MKIWYGLVTTFALLTGQALGLAAESVTTPATASASAPSCDASACKCKSYLPRGFDWMVGQVPARPWCGLRTFSGGMCTDWLCYWPGCTRCKGTCCGVTPCCTPPLYAYFLYPPARANAKERGPAPHPEPAPSPPNGPGPQVETSRPAESKPGNGKASESQQSEKMSPDLRPSPRKSP